MSTEDDRMTWYNAELQKDRDGYFMNNFYRHAVRLRKDDHVFKGSIQPGFGPDIPFHDFYDRDPDSLQGENRHSETFWAMTPRQFDEAIVHALEQEVGWDVIDLVLPGTDGEISPGAIKAPNLNPRP
ncbi:MAG: hypothetical protein Q8L37_00345 [Candidatus Gottesmanbacteria bacterium]|nr:hypothetical protein [Candidatus Gottesmanbacteria bacterium]